MGIDSGKTAAIACVDLDGKVVHISTGRSVGLDWFVDIIRKTGFPVVIAGDKKNPVALVARLSTIFDSVLFVPSSDISVEKKKALASDEVQNLHERDALAAAMTAYNAYSSKLRQAERTAREMKADADRVKALVVKRYSMYEAVSRKKAGRRFIRKR